MSTMTLTPAREASLMSNRHDLADSYADTIAKQRDTIYSLRRQLAESQSFGSGTARALQEALERCDAKDIIIRRLTHDVADCEQALLSFREAVEHFKMS
jgi:hypothetical protein